MGPVLSILDRSTTDTLAASGNRKLLELFRLRVSHVGSVDEGHWCDVQLEKAYIYKRVKDHERFFIDVSFNELHATDLQSLAEIIQNYPNVDICVADNCFSWDDLRSWLEDHYPDIDLMCVALFSMCHSNRIYLLSFSDFIFISQVGKRR